MIQKLRVPTEYLDAPTSVFSGIVRVDSPMQTLGSPPPPLPGFVAPPIPPADPTAFPRDDSDALRLELWRPGIRYGDFGWFSVISKYMYRFFWIGTVARTLRYMPGPTCVQSTAQYTQRMLVPIVSPPHISVHYC